MTVKQRRREGGKARSPVLSERLFSRRRRERRHRDSDRGGKMQKEESQKKKRERERERERERGKSFLVHLSLFALSFEEEEEEQARGSRNPLCQKSKDEALDSIAAETRVCLGPGPQPQPQAPVFSGEAPAAPAWRYCCFGVGAGRDSRGEAGAPPPPSRRGECGGRQRSAVSAGLSCGRRPGPGRPGAPFERRREQPRRR